MRLVRRKPRKLDGCGKLELERVIGLTTATPSGLACNGVSEEIAYIAGCVIVIYNVRTNSQTHFLTAQGSPKPFSCVAFSSQGGKYIAAGESGHQPAVVVWEVATRTSIVDLKSHKYGVSSVQFSPNGKHLVSLGLPHDGYMCLWDWKSGALLMKTRPASGSLVASTLQFATDGSFFVSGGSKHLKQWTIGGSRASSFGTTTNPGMDGKPIKLGSQKESMFVCISSAAASREQTAGSLSNQPIYALTSSGVLCFLQAGLAIEKWVDIQVRQAYALTTSDGYIACACSDGIVRIFSQGSLEYSATLPRPAPHGYHGLTDADVGAYLAVGNRVTAGIKFPDAIACAYLQQGQNIAVIYDDHSLYVWDVRSYSKIGRYRTFLSHSSCIWDVVSLPDPLQSTNVNSVMRGEAFATCSADGSIRLWHLDLGQDDTSKALPVHSSSDHARLQNVYSKDILGVLYIDTLGESKGRLSTTGAIEEPVDTAVGFRSISVSPDGNHLAAGDSSGNLRIFDLNSLLLYSFQEAHDAEILSLGYTTVVNEGHSCDTERLTSSLLASGGRDRLIHIYDVNRGYDVVETLDDHTASITTVRFACNGLKLLSCSADKSVVFRNLSMTSSGCKASRYHQEIATRGTIYDMDIDASDKLVVTVGQDKKLNILSLTSGKSVRCFKPEGDIGEPIKVRMDPSGAYVVCSHSDRCMRIYNFITGEPLAEASGHAEVITGVTFLPDCRRLISVSGDSCIFVWRLPITLSRAMRKRCSVTADSRPPLKTLKSSVPRSNIKEVPRAAKMQRFHSMKGDAIESRSVPLDSNENVCPTEHDENGESTAEAVAKKCQNVDAICKEKEGTVVGEVTPAAFKFSVSRLPPWAQAKIARDEAPASGGKEEANSSGNTRKAFQSRWAERLGRDGYKLFSEFMEESTPPPTIRPSGFGSKRRFSIEGGGVAESDSTPGSAISQLHSSPISGSSSIPKKENQWTSVHTVFLGDSDFDDISPKVVGPPDGIQAGSTQARSAKMKSSLGPKQGKRENEDEDVKGGSSDDEGDSVHVNAVVGVEQIVYYTPGSAGLKSNGGDKVLFKVSSKDKNEVTEDSHIISSSPVNLTRKIDENDGDDKRLSQLDSEKLPLDIEEDDVVEDDEFSPCRDLFSAHFDKLASDPKVGGSARRSFSARFFAQSNSKPPRSSLFPASPAGNRMKGRRDNQALLVGSDASEITPGKLFAAEKGSANLHEEDTGGAQPKNEILVNLDNADFWTPNQAFSTEKSGGKGGTEIRSKDLNLEGSPQTPDLLLSNSPQLAGERKGSLPPKLKTGTVAAAVEDGLASRVPSPKLREGAVEKVVFDRSEQSIGRIRHEAEHYKRIDESSGLSIDLLHSGNQEGTVAHVATEQLNSRGTESFLAAADVLNPYTRPLVDSTTDHEVEFEKDKEDHEEKVSRLSTGIFAFSNEVEEPFHSSEWETFSARRSTIKALPRPVEEYQRALKEMVDATSKASMLFDEIYSFCYKSEPAESGPDSANIPMSSLPPDVLRSGQAYQRLAPGSLQVIQRLADKVAACSFPPDSPDAAKSSDNAAVCDFSFRKTSDFGDNNRQSWPRPRTSGASLDSVLSSVDMENFISRYSETLASQVLALVQKSLPSTTPS
ncbi:hypothetical protein M758_7G073100 [Ceratodon purpureus]|nr:hypothetical protein M758_7G073100 [Ceratodon purpureus]